MFLKRCLQRFLSYWNRITQPLIPVDDPQRKTQIRFMASLLLTIAILTSVLLPPRYLADPLPLAIGRSFIALGSSAVIIGAYVFVRRGYYISVAYFIILYGSLIILGTTVYVYERSGLFTLYYMVIISLFSAVVLRPLNTILVIAVQSMVMLALGGWLGASITDMLTGPIAFHISLSAILTFLAWHNRRLVAEQNERYRQLFEQAPIAIWNMDFREVMNVLNALRAEGIADLDAHLMANPQLVRELFNKVRVRGINTTAISMIKAPGREALINHLQDLADENSIKGYQQDLVFLWEGRTQFTREFTVVRYDGQPIHNLANFIIPLKNGEPDYGDVIITITDITEQKQAEDERLARAIQHERVDLVDRLMEALSHDFRTSLASIETSRYLIERSLEQTTPDKIRQRLDVIRTNVFHLTEQLDNMSMVASFIRDNAKRVDLNELARHTIAQWSHEASRRHIQLDFQPDVNLPTIMGHGEELSLALTHLLNNAFNYTPPQGRVTVRTMTLPGNSSIAIEVADSGAGISEEHLPHIFDFFYRGDSARSTETGGMGLGLSIVRMVAEGHQGRVIVESRLNSGTVFRLILPSQPGIKAT